MGTLAFMLPGERVTTRESSRCHDCLDWANWVNGSSWRVLLLRRKTLMKQIHLRSISQVFSVKLSLSRY